MTGNNSNIISIDNDTVATRATPLAKTRVLEAAAYIGWNDPTRVQTILENMEKEIVRYAWQLSALDSAQWKSLQAPIGLAAAVHLLSVNDPPPFKTSGRGNGAMPEAASSPKDYFLDETMETSFLTAHDSSFFDNDYTSSSTRGAPSENMQQLETNGSTEEQMSKKEGKIGRNSNVDNLLLQVGMSREDDDDDQVVFEDRDDERRQTSAFDSDASDSGYPSEQSRGLANDDRMKRDPYSHSILPDDYEPSTTRNYSQSSLPNMTESTYTPPTHGHQSTTILNKSELEQRNSFGAYEPPEPVPEWKQYWNSILNDLKLLSPTEQLNILGAIVKLAHGPNSRSRVKMVDKTIWRIQYDILDDPSTTMEMHWFEMAHHLRHLVQLRNEKRQHFGKALSQALMDARLALEASKS